MTRPALHAPKRSVTRRRAAAAFSLLLAMSVLAIVPSSHPATADAVKTGKLSPRLQTLASGASFASPRAEARALSLPRSGFGSLVTRPDGRVLVYVRTSDTSPNGVADLRARGAQIVDVSPKYSTVTAAVAPGALQSVAADRAVEYVMEVLAPQVGAVGSARDAAAANAASPNVCAPIISEGDTLMNVAGARSTNNVDGTGETVGILSDSFNQAQGVATHAAQDVTNGDLPGFGNPCGHPKNVVVQSEGPGFGLSSDEGRAMAQLVHDLAPGANMAFATVENGELDFADQIDRLRTDNHATTIVDDAFYPNEPFFQDGPIASAARAAVAAGVPYFTAAGNSNLVVGGNNVSSYEAPSYRPAACPASVNLGEAVLDCHNFDTTGGTGTSDSITVANGGGFDLDLQWAEPRGAVATDLDVFLVNGSGSVLAKSTTKSTAAGQPVETLSWGNTSGSAQTVRVIVARYSGAATPRVKFVFVDSGGITAVQYNTSINGDVVGPAILGHSGTRGVGTTAAIPYNDSSSSEGFSSHGPATHYFQPAPSTAPLGSPDVIAKPDFAATDGVRTSFFAEFIGGVWRFYGTSAAAPQAAAIGALLIAKDPLLTPAQVLTTLHDTARSVANDGAPDAVGGGYLDAGAALASVTAVAGAPQSVRVEPGDGQVALDWAPPLTTGGIPITGYSITPYIGTTAQSPHVYNSTATSQLVTGLTNGVTYTFRVAALDANGAGAPSDPTSPVNVGAPFAPDTVSAAGGNARATLEWTKPRATNGSTITGYVIAPFLNGVAQAQHHVGTVLRATVTGLTNGGHYTFQVAATSNRGNGAFSSAVAVTVGAPGRPTHLTVVPGDTFIKVTFTAAPGNGAPVSENDVDVYEGSFVYNSYRLGTATTQYANFLTAGHTYRLRITAVNSYGAGPPSDLSQLVTVGTPTPPGSPRVTAGNATATLHWSASANNGSAITKYVVTPYVAGVAQAARTYGAKATGATIAGLKNGKSFSFQVKALNARGSGPPSTSPAVVIGAPGPPAKVTAKTGHAKATLSWTAPAANGAPITGYRITPYRGGVALQPRVFHSAATTETVTGLGSGDTLTFTVAAINARGAGVPSARTKAILIN